MNGVFDIPRFSGVSTGCGIAANAPRPEPAKRNDDTLTEEEAARRLEAGEVVLFDSVSRTWRTY